MEHDDEVILIVQPDSRHLRAVRLLAADAGGRAGLDASQVDDLRIAVDELFQAILEHADERVVLRVVRLGRRVVIRASARARDRAEPPRLGNVAELIVDAVCDGYSLDRDGNKVSFMVTKRAHRMVSA